MLNSNWRSMSFVEWRSSILRRLEDVKFGASTTNQVTLLAYHFWSDSQLNDKFTPLAASFLCAFYNLGLVKSKLVVNKTTCRIGRFCDKYGIEIEVEKRLRPGMVSSMCIDCISRLYERFSTEYVLIIQNDGFLVRGGLEEFLWRYDYVGAPWPGHMGLFDWFPYPKYAIGNGGFSLRSRDICEAAAKAYNRYFRLLPYTGFLGDDVFYGKTMPFLSPRWRNMFRYPTVDAALRFSVECESENFNLPPSPPLGFHGMHGFEKYVEHYGIPMEHLL